MSVSALQLCAINNKDAHFLRLSPESAPAGLFSSLIIDGEERRPLWAKLSLKSVGIILTPIAGSTSAGVLIATPTERTVRRAVTTKCDAWKVSIYVESGFPLISYASVLSALSASNGAAKVEKFQWRTVSITDIAIQSDCGVVLETEALSDNGCIKREGETKQFLVLLSNSSDARNRKLVLSWIRKSLSRGARVLSVGDGTKLLCEAGILNGKRCAVHWSKFGAMVENYPRVFISRSIYENDGAISTCPGELSTFDAVMRLISSELSAEVLDTVFARSLQSMQTRDANRQSIPDQVRLERLNSPLLRVVDLMEENIAEPIPLEDLFQSARISRRQAERLFGKQMGTSPKRFYMRVRLERALELLRHTPLQVAEVAAATGFISHSHFSKTFKAVFGILPVTIKRSSTEMLDNEVRFDRSSASSATTGVLEWSRSLRAEALTFVS